MGIQILVAANRVKESVKYSNREKKNLKERR